MVDVAQHRTAHPAGSPGAVLAMVRQARSVERAAAADILAGAAEWASMHVTFDGDEAAGWWTSGGMVSLAGDGAPLVAEFAIGEFAAALGVSTDSGRRLIGGALELAFRLPKTWQGVQSLQVPAWQGRRIAQQTTALPRGPRRSSTPTWPPWPGGWAPPSSTG